MLFLYYDCINRGTLPQTACVLCLLPPPESLQKIIFLRFLSINIHPCYTGPDEHETSLSHPNICLHSCLCRHTALPAVPHSWNNLGCQHIRVNTAEYHLKQQDDQKCYCFATILRCEMRRLNKRIMLPCKFLPVFSKCY